MTDRVRVRAHRILLDTGSVQATAPMLRGVWGRALRALDPMVKRRYATLFEGHDDDTKHGSGRRKMPLYVLRPAPPDPLFAPAVDLLLCRLGKGCDHAIVALNALTAASVAGLGARREPFRIDRICGISPDGQTASGPKTWYLRSAAECLAHEAARRDALRLEFEGPLRILRKGKLLQAPSFADISVTGLRRLIALASDGCAADLPARVLEAARCLSASQWRGRRQDLVRWSGRQNSRVEMWGVTGRLVLPDGAGPLRPLLAACQWIHIGKGTVFGLGKLGLALERPA